MSTIYYIKSTLNINFNFEDIEKILNKKNPDVSTYSDCFNFEKISFYEIINHLIKMYKEEEPVSIHIEDKKHKQYYTISFYDTNNYLNIELLPYNDKKDFLYDAYYPDMALYMEILLNLVENYTILNLTIDRS